MKLKIKTLIIGLFAASFACYANGIGTNGYAYNNDNDTDTVGVDTIAQDSVEQIEKLPYPLNIQSRIDKLRESKIFKTSMAGMMVYDLTADSVIYSYNEQQLMRPASTLKMMVAVAALDRLGCDYRYHTVMAHTGDVENHVLKGDIYIKGGFDPTIEERDLDVFVDSLKSLDVDTIRGNIYADVTMKDSDRLGEGWCWDDDNPVLSPLLVSRKEEFTERLANRIRKEGIVFTGELRTDKMPRSAREICVMERKVDDVMHDMLKESDNLYSESLFYQLAASAGGTATAKQGRAQMNRLIDKLGFKPSRYYIADGSGLSLYNYVSPELEVAFLKYAYKNDCIYSRLMLHLPIAGKDGTLEKRMRKGAAKGNVFAKTGTVTGVSALAGYCTAANGHRLCFSIINMGIRHASSGRDFQDLVCEALCR
ncbi:MAG: D-alanyl-D-alanine carboxypeptidase/D-alanyl-D-alanine-endopeptidase [Prevotellaceae bacterium]|nr:D-alanyl-D-alanine carboxypeptidase/D-alanyl-D-alanine-endopeptidase [Prevotellaceae bacterium]